MMGYAHAAGDLGRPAEVGELRTGDLARRDDAGRFSIVGRVSRFAKLLGQRIDLDQVQQALAPYDRGAVCASDDQRLIVATTTGDPDLLRRRAAKLTGLPPALVAVRRYEEIPRLPNGKPNLLALTALSQRPETAATDVLTELRRTFAEALGYDQVPDDSSFVRLGGDSLSFVEVSLRLEETLGTLPDRWPELTIRELANLKPPAEEEAAGESPDPQSDRQRRWRAAARVDTAAALRAVAITLVVLSHLEITAVRGGAHLLLGLAGFGFARFQLSAIRHTDNVQGLARSIARVAVPSVVFISLVVLISGNYSLANIFLINHYLGPPQWTETWNFWFVEALVEILLAVLVLLAIPGVRRFERRFPLLLPGLLLAAGLLVRYDAFGWAPESMQYGRPYAIAWLFALGWLIQRAQSIPARLAVSGIVLLTLTGYFPAEPVRGVVVQVGLLLVLWIGAVPLPRQLAPVVRVVAGASLWIYLTHWVVWPFLLDQLGLPAGVAAGCCLIAGAATTALLSHGRQVTGRLGNWLVPALRWNRPLSVPAQLPSTTS
jgi:peptidoglycan/LPS O-acetylase OafA/YrhL